MKRSHSFDTSAVCYLVATPIGNLGDFSSRAQDVLNTVDLIACEDTRTSAILLNHFNIRKPLVSYHEHNEQESSSKLIEHLKKGKSIALISDAGYPGISDPGAILVKHCIEEGIPVSIIPGANAFLPALIGSGLPNDHFYFHGFLPSKPSQRKKELSTLIEIPVTLIFYESPHRIKETLQDFDEYFPNRRICLVREITKRYEEYIYGTAKEILSLDPSTLKGEMVLVVEGKKKEEIITDEKELLSMLKIEINQGASLKEAAKNISNRTGQKKNFLYSLALTLKK